MLNWLNVQNKNDITEIFINGDIESDVYNDGYLKRLGMEDTNIYPLEIKKALDEANGKDVHIHINSGGGNLFAGLAISNMIKQHKGKTTAYIDGLAGSSASLIAFGCDEINIPKNAYLMIHRPTVCTEGNVEDFQKTIEILEELEKGILNTYMAKVKENVTEEEIYNMVKAETWFTGEQASLFFNVVVNEMVDVLNYAKTSKVYNNIPKALEEAKKTKLSKEIDIMLNI